MKVGRATRINISALTLFLFFVLCFPVFKMRGGSMRKSKGLGMHRVEAPGSSVKSNGFGMHRVEAPGSSVKFVYSKDLVTEYVRIVRYQHCQALNKTLASLCDFEPTIDNKDDMDIEFTKRLPGCVITGAYESGIRELVQLLNMNPQVVTRRKRSYQVNYFQKRGGNVLGLYRNQMPLSHTGQITVDSSPAYFYGERTPQNMYAMNSSLRLIVVIRNPLRRAMSEFYLTTPPAKSKYGNSFYSCAFDRAMMHIDQKCPAVQHSRYDIPIARYLRYFNRDKILVIDADEFKRNPYRVLNTVEDHIGIQNVIRKDHFVYNDDDGMYCITTGGNMKDAVCSDRDGVGLMLHENGPLDDKLMSWFKYNNRKLLNLTRTRFGWL